VGIRILWAVPALSDLHELRDYVSNDDPAAARKLARAIRQRVEGLVQHPAIGRVVPELPSSGYRELIVPLCRIVYEYAGAEETVTILRVWHALRDLSGGW